MRTLSSELTELFESGNYGRRALVLFDMPSGYYGFWDDAYDITYSGRLYKAIPGVFRVSPMGASMDLIVNKVDITFSGLDSEVNAHIENEQYHRRPVTIHIAIIDEQNGVVVEVLPWFSGIIDTAETVEKVGGPTTLTVRLESGNWELNRVGTRTRTDNDQRQIDALDGSFRYVTAAVTKPIWWGKAGPKHP